MFARHGARVMGCDIETATAEETLRLARAEQLPIDRLRANLESSALDPGEVRLVTERLDTLRACVDAEPKTMKWRARSRVGDKVRWYQQPEEEGGGERP